MSLNTKSTGRLVGALMLVQWLAGVLVNAVLTRPLFGEPGFLVSAAQHSTQLAVSALLGLLTGVLAVAIAVTAWSSFRSVAPRLAIAYVALAAASFAVTSVEQLSVMSMVSLSEAYSAAGQAEKATFDGLAIVVRSARNWAHYTALLTGSVTLLAFYVNLFVSGAAARALGVAGIVAVLLQMSSLGMPFFGGSVDMRLLAPIGIVQLLVSVWLLARGFRAPPAPH